MRLDIYAVGNGRIGLGVILGPTDDVWGILNTNSGIDDQIPKNTAAFAEIGGGDMLLIDRNAGTVSVWLHDEALPSRAITPIFNSFREFLDALFVVPDEPLPSLKDLGLDLKAMGLERD